jgi:hypothetical protein
MRAFAARTFRDSDRRAMHRHTLQHDHDEYRQANTVYWLEHELRQYPTHERASTCMPWPTAPTGFCLQPGKTSGATPPMTRPKRWPSTSAWIFSSYPAAPRLRHPASPVRRGTH